MQQNTEQLEMTAPSVVLTPEALLDHWQGHRKLTRRVIDTFPEDKLFTYSVGGMRPFSELAMEMIKMTGPGMEGIVTGEWNHFDNEKHTPPTTKEELLRLWDETTGQINELWPQVKPGRFQERDLAFGQYEGPIYWTLFYFIDNEVHHRGQGYVYLRTLGIEPPPFWDRQ